MWSRVEFPNGDKVMVSMARNEIKVFKLRWGGLVPGRTLATLDALHLMARWNLLQGHTAESRSVEVLDRVTAAVAACDDAATIEASLASAST